MAGNVVNNIDAGFGGFYLKRERQEFLLDLGTVVGQSLALMVCKWRKLIFEARAQDTRSSTKSRTRVSVAQVGEEVVPDFQNLKWVSFSDSDVYKYICGCVFFPKETLLLGSFVGLLLPLRLTSSDICT